MRKLVDPLLIAGVIVSILIAVIMVLAGQDTVTSLIVGLLGTVIALALDILNGIKVNEKLLIDGLAQTITDSTSVVIESLKGMEFKRFKTGDDLMRYMNGRLLQAQHRVDDLSWSSVVGLGYGLNITQDLSAQFEERITLVAQRIPYREVFIFNRVERVAKLERRIARNLPGYSCAYHDCTKIPLLQFIIIDNEEVIILTDQLESKAAIRHPDLVKLLAEYYEEVWRTATPIKVGPTVREDVLQKIRQEAPGIVS